MSNAPLPLISATDLSVRLGFKRRLIRKDEKGFPILSRVNFSLYPGQVTALVGESGSGKTTLGRSLVGLTKIHEGSLAFKGQNLAGMSQRKWRRHRKDLQFIFQDPLSSLNPRLKIGRSLSIPVRQFGTQTSPAMRDSVALLLDQVGLDQSFADRYPHQLSGGQRQRVGIARALAANPQLIIADEVVSGLDVSSQARILALIKDLKSRYNLSVLFITHDLSVVRALADRIIVMSNGRVREDGPVDEVFETPQHSYTRKLLSTIPSPEFDPQWLGKVQEGKLTMKIENSVALVTGANRGIGEAYVKELLARGASKVYATARDADALATLSKLDERVTALSLDITDQKQVDAAAKAASDVTLLINNAGYNSNTGAIASDNLDAAREEMDVNYFGTLSMIRAFSPVLKSTGGGAIVNMLSILSRVSLPLMGTLCASKAAGLSMTQAVRSELRAQGTAVLAVMPGAVDTDMTKGFPPPKMDPSDVARAGLNAVEEGEEDVYPGDMAQGLFAGLEHDPKAVERELGEMLPGS